MKYVEVRSSLIRSDAVTLRDDGMCGGFVYWSCWPPIESRFAFYVGIFGNTQN